MRHLRAPISVAVAATAVLLAGCNQAQPTTTAPTTSAPAAATSTTTAAPAAPPTTAAPTTTAAPDASTTTTTAAPTTTTAPPATTVPPAVQRDTHIIYTTKSGTSTFQLARMRVDGTQRVRLTDDTRFEHHWPRPSPDGSKILFYRADPGQGVNDIGTNSLWVMDADGTNVRQLIPRGAFGWVRQGHAEWSPDGTRIVMTAGSGELELWTTDAQGQNPRRILSRRNVVNAVTPALDPSWAPDGRTVVFTGCPRDLIFCFPWNYEIFRADTVTGAETRLTNDGVADFDPYVSPDGSSVVWLRCSGSFPSGPWGLYRLPFTGAAGTPAKLLDDGNVNSNANWSHDGRTLLFQRTVMGGPGWMTTAQVRSDGSGVGLVGGSYAPADEGGSAYWP